MNKITCFTEKSKKAESFLLGFVLFTGFCIFQKAAASELQVGVGYPYSTIADAVNNSVAGDTIVIHQGQYILSSSIPLPHDLAFKGVQGDSVTIDGNNNLRIFADATGRTVVLDNLTIINANVSYP